MKPEVQAAYNEQVQRELADTVWGDSCHSWYKTESGKITNNWSGTTAAVLASHGGPEVRRLRAADQGEPGRMSPRGSPIPSG